MKEFLDTAYNLWRLNQVSEADAAFSLVFAAVAALQSVHSKSQLDLDNIESVFTTCEMAKTLGRFPGEPGKDIDALIRALKVVIVKTLEKTVKFPFDGNKITSPPPYDRFARLLQNLRENANPKQGVSIITFNYDIALDYALHDNDFIPDYGLAEKAGTGQQSISLLKLHGSLNWTETIPTVTENEVVPWDMQQYLQTHRVKAGGTITSCVIPIGSQLGELATKGGRLVTGEAVLVPPTWNKAENHRALNKVWAKAANALSEAENIFIVGYSMPETDAFFRYLYALGTVGQVMLKRFWVFDIDNSGIVKQRFSNLLGPGAKARFDYIEKPFADAILLLEKTFLPPSKLAFLV